MTMYLFPLTKEDLKNNKELAETAEYAIQNKSRWVNVDVAKEDIYGCWDRETLKIHVNGTSYNIRRFHVLISEKATVIIGAPVLGITGKEVGVNAGLGVWPKS